jgi:hypothetical protein
MLSHMASGQTATEIGLAAEEGTYVAGSSDPHSAKPGKLPHRCWSAMAPSRKLVNLVSVMCESLLVGKLFPPMPMIEL